MNRLKFAAVACLAASLVTQARAEAAQVNIAATAFHTQFGVTGGIFYSSTIGVNFSAGSLTMIAALPRVPAGTVVSVFVDGLGVTGTYSCTVSSSVASRSFSRTSPVNWTQSVNFTAAELPGTSYLSINCSVPSDGGFYGVTVTG
jgi:hypothetical protein